MSTAAPEDLIRRRRRKRPRRLRSVDLPSDLYPATLAGLYESTSASSDQGVVSGGRSTSSADGDSGLAMSLLSTEWVERPLPPMSVLATVQTGKSGGGSDRGSGGRNATTAAGPDCSPLLTDFLKSIGFAAGADGNDNDAQAEEGGALINKGHTDDGGKDDEAGSQNEGPVDTTVDTPPPPATGSVMPEIEPIDDPNRSTLTAGQHKRYLQLWTELRAPSSLGAGSTMNSSGKTTPKNITPREREFRSLDKIARQEWAAYGQAMAEFQRRNADRFLLGFREKEGGSSGSSSGIGTGRSASDFVQSAAATKNKRMTNQSDDGTAKVYGGCVQEVSLQGMAAVEMGSHGDGGARRRWQASGVFDTKSYSAQIVHSTPPDGVARMDRDWVDKLSSPGTTESLHPHFASPRGNFELSSPESISCDGTAARLAREHNVDVVMTADSH